MLENHQHCVYPHVHMETKIRCMCLLPSSLDQVSKMYRGWMDYSDDDHCILILDATEDDRG